MRVTAAQRDLSRSSRASRTRTCQECRDLPRLRSQLDARLGTLRGPSFGSAAACTTASYVPPRTSRRNALFSGTVYPQGPVLHHRMNPASTSEFHPNEVFWAHSVQSLYVPGVQYFSKALFERLLPPFNNLAEEANKFSEEEYRRLGALPALNASDCGELAEMAHDSAASWCSSMAAVKQSVINLYAVGLRHLFEQQLFDFVRHVPLTSRNSADYEKDCAALRQNGIDVDRFKSWSALEELRLVCNAVKHAEGSATHQLENRRPDIFVPQATAGVLFVGRPGLVLQPLAGEDIYLREGDVEEYAATIERFWNEVSQRLEQMAATAR